MSRSALAAALSVVLLGSALHAKAADGGKIPITTSSAPAREAFLHGRDLAEKLRVQVARADFERAVALDPGFAQAQLALANAQPSAKQFFESLAHAVSAAAKASEGERLLIEGADAGAHGDNAKQTEIYGRLVALYPIDERAHLALGNAHFGAQRYAEAIKEYEAAVKIAPSFSQPYNQLGYSYRFQGEPAKAETAFKKYIELIPDDPNPYDSYAELLLKLGRFDESIAMYRKALAIDAGFVNSRFGIATDLDLQGKGAEARRELDAMLEGAQDDGQRRAGLFAKAVSFAHQGDLRAAQAEMDKQYAIAEKSGDTLGMAGDLVAMGNIALESGDVAGAEARFRRAGELVQAAPNVAAANKENQRRFQVFLQARVALAKGDVAGAKKLSDGFGEQVAASGNPFQKRLAHEIAGQIALAEKRWAQAAVELRQANLIDPYNVYRLSLAEAGRGEVAEAKRLAESALHDNGLTSLNHAFVRRRLASS
jgi:tetratricopeptide (TPR) repeat protein